jgi:photosystem II stability/assembly factor-like uncharacterized protein
MGSLRILATAFPTSQQGFLSGTQVSGKRTLGFVDGTHDGGVSWQPLALVPGTAFVSLHFNNARIGWALGEPIAGEQNGLNPHELFKTVNGGRTWTPIIKAADTISSLVVTPAGVPWISVNGPCTKTGCTGSVMTPVGKTFATVWTAPGPVMALALHDSQMTAEVASGASQSKSLVIELYIHVHGTNWTPVGFIASFPGMGPPSQTIPLTGQVIWTSRSRALASVFSMGSCAMAGCAITEVAETHNSGSTWAPVKSVQIACQFEPRLAGRARQAVVAQSVNLAACAGPGTDLFVSENGGAHFTRRTQWPQTTISSIGVGAHGMLWAVANADSVIVSHNGGQEWIQSFPSPTPTGTLVSVSPQVAYGAGDQSDPAVLLKTVDGGATWQPEGSLGMREAVAMAFPSPQDSWVAAVPVPGEFNTSSVWLHSTDGGRHWFVAAGSPAAHNTFYPVIRFFSARRALWINLSANCAGSCPAFGAETTNGGTTWHTLNRPHTPNNIVSAAILSPHTIIVATLGVIDSPAGIYETTNTGQTWHKLTSIPATLNGAFDIAFPTGRVGYMVVNDVIKPVNKQAGQPQKAILAILKTTDGGRQWTLHTLPHIPDDWFASLTFVSPQVGLLDANGHIWKTTNGGRAWTEMP